MGTLCKCAQSFCDTLGGHLTSWVQNGSVNARIPWKTGVQRIRRAKTNQRDSKREFNYEPEGREFESLRVRHSSPTGLHRCTSSTSCDIGPVGITKPDTLPISHNELVSPLGVTPLF